MLALIKLCTCMLSSHHRFCFGSRNYGCGRGEGSESKGSGFEGLGLRAMVFAASDQEPASFSKNIRYEENATYK